MRGHTISNLATLQNSFSPLKASKVLCGARNWIVSRDCDAVFNDFCLLLWGHELGTIDGQGLEWRIVPGETIDVEDPDRFGAGRKIWDPFSLAVDREKEGADTKLCRIGAWSNLNKAKDLALQHNLSSATVAEDLEKAVLGREGPDKIDIGGVALGSLSFIVVCEGGNPDIGPCKTGAWSSLIKAKHLASQ